MEQINTPDVLIQNVKGELVLTHRKTGMTAKATIAQLERWALNQLRAQLTKPSPVKEKA